MQSIIAFKRSQPLFSSCVVISDCWDLNLTQNAVTPEVERRKSRDEIRAEKNFALLCYTWRECLVSLAGPDVLPQFTRKKSNLQKKKKNLKLKKKKSEEKQISGSSVSLQGISQRRNFSSETSPA